MSYINYRELSENQLVVIQELQKAIAKEKAENKYLRKQIVKVNDLYNDLEEELKKYESKEGKEDAEAGAGDARGVQEPAVC